MIPKKKLLVIAQVWPEPSSSAAGYRILQILSLFPKESYQITLVSAAEKSPYSFDFKDLEVNLFPIKLNDASFDIFVKELNPELVLFDRFMMEEQFGWRVREQVPSAMTILDTEDIHFLRDARKKALKEKIEFQNEMLFSDLAKREIASILRCDLTLIISEVEVEILSKIMQVPSDLLFYLPFLLDEILPMKLNFEERIHFSFIGNCFHEPNTDAIQVLKTEIWPQIRKKLPDVELHIYGAYMPEKIVQLHSEKEGFLIKDRAEDVSQMMQKSRVFLAPLRFGAGQKGKLFEAMIHALPSVTSSIGAESMNGNLAWNGFVSDNWDEFSEKATTLYLEKEKWKMAVENGKRILEKRFLKSSYENQFLGRIRNLQSNLAELRNQHFIGQILQTNALNSYKYLSKWIEEKNKISNNS